MAEVDDYDEETRKDILFGRAARRGNDYDRADLKTDLEHAYSLQNHPKRNDLFTMAWERGHSSGINEVISEYDDLADLLS